MTGRGQASLTARLLRRLVLPVAALALIMGAAGSFAIRQTVTSVNDRILSGAARSIADSLATEDGEITLDLSPAVFGMLENTERDNVYYSIRQGARIITGYPDLPQIAIEPNAPNGFSFANGRYLGNDVRIVAVTQNVPQVVTPLVIQVAETLEGRRRTAQNLLLGLVLLELILIAAAALILPLAVARGLAPLGRLRSEMDQRGGDDLTPLSTSGVPKELNDLVKAFNTLLARFDRNTAGVRRFTADASHQMRTPLSILRTHVEVLRRSPPDSPEAGHAIEDIDDASRRLSHLLSQLLTLARADSAQPQQLQPQRIDLNQVAMRVVDDQASHAHQQNIAMTLDTPSAPVWVESDPGLLNELLANLLDNAIRYNHEGGHVALRITAAPPTISIEDDGPGIAPEDRERAFQRFIRLTPMTRREGSGLGLPIARSLADILNVALMMRGGPDGRGLTVEVIFTAQVE